ncbi:MAG: hypothetical protein ACJ790_04715, partial [Myxococcaceae bacterium]
MQRLGWWGAVVAALVLWGCGGGAPGAGGGDENGSGQGEIYQPTTRTYYIAADEVKWDYAPTGSNQITWQPFGDIENTYM